MKTWAAKFIASHGDRLFFGAVTFLLGMIFLHITGLEGTGKTLLTGLAVIVSQQIKSPEKGGKE